MIMRFIIVGILLVLLSGGLIGFNIYRDQATEAFFDNMQQQPVAVSTTEAKTVTWRQEIEAVGTVRAAQGVELAVEVSGVVREILFDANQRVEQGQRLVQLDDALERADMAAAEAAIARDRQALERARTLSERGVSAESTLDNAETALAASRSELARIEAQIDKKALEAPFAGTIGIPQVDVGAYVAAGTAIATLQGLDRMRVDFTVREQDRPRLEVGQPVRVAGAAGAGEPAGERHSGEIIGIDPRIDPSSRLVSVRAELEVGGGALFPGQFAHVGVLLAEEEGIVALPETAVVDSLYGDHVYVVTEADPPPEEPGEDEAPAGASGGALAQEDSGGEGDGPGLVVRQVFVEIGRRMGGMIEVTDGVEPGDRAVVAGQNRLTSGVPVTVDDSLDPTEAVAREGGGR